MEKFETIYHILQDERNKKNSTEGSTSDSTSQYLEVY